MWKRRQNWRRVDDEYGAGMMDLTIRDWMVIIGVLLIMAVLLDAWRRVRSERYSRVALKLTDPEEESSARDADLASFRELPNGGARVVERDDLLQAAASRDRSNLTENAQAQAPDVVKKPARKRRSAATPPTNRKTWTGWTVWRWNRQHQRSRLWRKKTTAD
jgi:cell division protein ZipA